MKRLIYLVLAVMLVAVACGDDAEDEFADDLVTAILADESLENPLQDPDDAQCMVDGLMDEYGMDRLTELGVTPDAEDLMDLTTTGAGMTDDERDTFTGVYLSCLDAVAFMGEMLADGGFPEADAQCMATTLGEDFVGMTVSAQLSGETFNPLDDPEAAAGFQQVVATCVSDPAQFMADVMAAEGLPAETADCIGAGITDEMGAALLPAFLASALSGAEFDISAFPELLTLVTTCMIGG